MAIVKMKNEIDVIFEKLNSFLFLENLGGVVDIEIRPRENGIFLRIIPVEQRRDVWISEGRVVEEAEEEPAPPPPGGFTFFNPSQFGLVILSEVNSSWGTEVEMLMFRKKI